MRRDAVVGLIAVAVVAGIAYWRWSGERGTAPPPRATAAAPQQARPNLADAAVPSFDVVRVNPQGEAVFAGSAAPGTEVSVLDGSKPLGRVTADEHGDWVLLLKERLASGEHQLSLTGRAADGAVSRSDSVVATMVPQRTPSVVAAQANDPVAVLVPR